MTNKDITVIMSKDGGVGKTWFAATLSHILAVMKKKILFVDFDLGTSNIYSQFGLEDINELEQVISGQITINQAISHFEKARIDIISSPSGQYKIVPEMIGALQNMCDDIILLSSSYDHIIVDTDSDFNKSTKTILGCASTAILMTDASAVSLVETYDLLREINESFPKLEIVIVINKVNSIVDGRRAYNTLLTACERYIDIKPKLLGIIRKDTRVRDTIRNKTPMVLRFPTSEAIEDMTVIARKILTQDI